MRLLIFKYVFDTEEAIIELNTTNSYLSFTTNLELRLTVEYHTLCSLIYKIQSDIDFIDKSEDLTDKEIRLSGLILSSLRDHGIHKYNITYDFDL